MKQWIATLPLLLCNMSFAQSVDRYEERPGFGLYAEWVRISNLEFSYQEVVAEGSGIPVKYKLKDPDFQPSPILGVTGMVPFLWHNYLSLQATVGGQLHSFELVKADTNSVPEGRETEKFSTFSFVIQGGPEVGYPVWSDFNTQQLFKPVVYGNILVSKTLNSGTSFTNDMMFALTTGGGLRYSVKRLSATAGVKWGWWYWKPTYDDSKSSLDPVTKEDQNRLRMTYRQVASPYIDLKYSIF